MIILYLEILFSITGLMTAYLPVQKAKYLLSKKAVNSETFEERERLSKLKDRANRYFKTAMIFVFAQHLLILLALYSQKC